MDKLRYDVPEERAALEEMFGQLMEAFRDESTEFILVPGTNALTNEDVNTIAIETDGGILPVAVMVMPGEIVPRKSRTQKEIEERESNREFVLPEDARAEEYIAPLSLDDFGSEDDDDE